MNDPRSEKLNAVVGAVQTVNRLRRTRDEAIRELVAADTAAEKLAKAGHPAGDAQAEANRLRLVTEEAERAFTWAELELEILELGRLGRVAS